MFMHYMNIDLNLQNYTKQDIEKLFGISPGYLEQEVIQKELELSTKLTRFQVNGKTKQDIMDFLRRARERLTETPLVPMRLNPIERKSVSRLICVDTLFRPQYALTKSSDFTYVCPEYIKNVTSLKISSIELPNVWYVFSSTARNNFFHVNGVTITIPDGNYTSAEMELTLTTQLKAELDDTYYATVSPITGCVAIFSTSSFSINFGVSGLPLYQTCGWTLGFRKEAYTMSASYQGEGSYGASFDNYVFVDVDDFQSNFLTDAVVSVTQGLNGQPFYLGNTIMARIPITTNANTIMFNNGADMLFKTREYFGPVKLERLRIRILNKYGNVVDMNQNDYSISLEINETYS